MLGAPALAANAALRAGAGLVTLAVPAAVQVAAATLAPCATSIPLPERPDGLLDPRQTLTLFRRLRLLHGPTAPTVVAGGPGLGRGDASFDRAWFALLDTIGGHGIPIVLDADGLNALHRGLEWSGPGWDTWRHFRGVVTPHPGEMARLHGVSVTDVEKNREHYACSTARAMTPTHRHAGHAKPETPSTRPTVTVVLKGENSVVTDGERVFINRTGNPGMATGGSGDVLTGVIAALIAQGLTYFDAAVAGTHLHGLAGDLASRRFGEISMTAADLLDFLPPAFRKRRP